MFYLIRFLETAAEQELYASDHQELIESSEIACEWSGLQDKLCVKIIFVGCLHGDEIIVLQDGRLDHPPVVTYFTRYNTKRHLWKYIHHGFRFFWNHKEFCLQVGIYLNILPLDCTEMNQRERLPNAAIRNALLPGNQMWKSSDSVGPAKLGSIASVSSQVIQLLRPITCMASFPNFQTFQGQYLKFPTSPLPEVEVYILYLVTFA